MSSWSTHSESHHRRSWNSQLLNDRSGPFSCKSIRRIKQCNEIGNAGNCVPIVFKSSSSDTDKHDVAVDQLINRCRDFAEDYPATTFWWCPGGWVCATSHVQQDWFLYTFAQGLCAEYRKCCLLVLLSSDWFIILSCLFLPPCVKVHTAFLSSQMLDPTNKKEIAV